jgi:hypothetical protein
VRRKPSFAAFAFFFTNHTGGQMLSTNPIAALFGKSPFKPMQKHMRMFANAWLKMPGCSAQ